MECQEYEALEQSFVDVRLKRLKHLSDETLTAAMEEELSRAELKALLHLLDHCAEHGCRGRRATKLPASRKIGGIIGPY
jgi:hypothetical protein